MYISGVWCMFHAALSYNELCLANWSEYFIELYIIMQEFLRKFEKSGKNPEHFHKSNMHQSRFYFFKFLTKLMAENDAMMLN